MDINCPLLEDIIPLSRPSIWYAYNIDIIDKYIGAEH